MTSRPPTLRENRRYLLVRIEPAGTPIDQKEVYYAISNAITSLWGDAAGGNISQAVVAAESGHLIIRCLRGTERELAIALSTVTACRDLRIALRIVSASGTMESLRERIRKEPRSMGTTGKEGAVLPGCVFAGKPFIILHGNGQKVDVIEKGFKNTHRLFLTSSDMENS